MTDTPAQFDLITIGDSTIDTFIRIHEASVECDLNRRDCKLCVPYGSKIPVDKIAYGVAGNAANVAVGAARLGLKTAIYTNLGDDNQGRRIHDALLENAVFGDYIVVNKDKTSNLSVVLTFQGERTIFVYHQDWFYTLPKLKNSSWIYLTSMAQSFTNSNIMDEICHYIEKSNAKMIFAPGTYQLKADIKRYPAILEKCELLIVNFEEAKLILDVQMSDFIKTEDILSKLILLGVKNVVVTDGAEGSWAYDGEQFLKAGIIKTEVFEKTGAGDAYASALVAALASGESLKEAMAWGTINAASAISTTGPQKGLLSRDNLLKKRKEISDFNVAIL